MSDDSDTPTQDGPQHQDRNQDRTQREAPNRSRTTSRIGPSPLPLHLWLQILVWMSSRAALPSSRKGLLPWRPHLAEQAETLRQDMLKVDPDELARAIDAQAVRRLTGFMEAVGLYHRHPSRRDLADPPTLWEQGSSRLLDYGATAPGGDQGAPLLVVPSLINRAYIMDLTQRRSLLRHLAAHGVRPLMLDWGEPGPLEQGFSLSDYVGGRLEDTLDACLTLVGQPVNVLGYCMGGMLALALAQRRPEAVDRLVMLATPWDFHADDQGPARLLRSLAPQFGLLLQHTRTLPVMLLQAMVASLDPFLTSRKFRRFAAMDADSERAREFVALEDWLNDGIPLAGPVAREMLVDWYAENTPARSRWIVRQRPVLPAEVTARTLVVIPEQDYIVPPSSTAPLVTLIPKAESWRLAAGHIGMVASSRAPRTFYTPLARWLGEAIH